ncbi:MAG: ferrous iron transport protein A [Deltaproteobacteria bacterium]|nr:MAG: ferrous iron transport protein A [Deltaproteobacteria bacterium]
MALPLSQMKTGQKGVVIQIAGGRGLNSRLAALGIRIGHEVTKVSSMLMAGPVVVKVGNTEIALGFGMAQKIIVEVNE